LVEKGINLDEKIITNEVLYHLRGNINLIIRHKNGSKLLINCLKNTSDETTHKIFLDILNYLNHLFLDLKAHNFCIKLFNHLSRDDRFNYLKKVKIILIIGSTNFD
jgi:hypothetical protein